MNSKKIAKLGAAISFLGGLLILVVEYFRHTLCPGFLCIYDVKDIAEPLFFFLAAFVPVFIILIFTKQQVFTTWKKFAIPYIVISALIIFFAGNSGGGWGVGSIIDSREGVTMFLSTLFLIISLFIIAIKSWRLRK